MRRGRKGGGAGRGGGREGRKEGRKTIEHKKLKFNSAVLKIYSFYFMIWI